MGPTWKNDEERKILAEVYQSFATKTDPQTGFPVAFQEWFRGAGIVDSHPSTQQRTLVINCNYRPFLMMKDIIALSDKFGIKLFLQEVDSNGKPVS
jgi:hypothetical protein